MKHLILICLVLSCVFAVKLQEQSSLSSTGPADLLQDHLTEIETDIREEEFEHKKLYDSQHQQCSDEISAREVSISDGEDALRNAESHFIRCETAYNGAQADLAQVIQYQSSIKANLQQLEVTRNQEKLDLQTLIEEELDPAIYAVEGAFPIIEEFASGATEFVQVSKHMTKTFKHMVKSGKGGNMAGVLTALVTLGSGQFKASDLAEVKQLFTNLLNDLKEAKNNAIENEAIKQQVYETTVAEFQGILARLETTQTELENYSTEMATCQIEEQAIIDEASAKVRNNKQALENALAMCSAFETEYENASAGRQAEIKLLQKLKEFIEEQAEIFGEYGAENSGALDEYNQSNLAQINSFIQTRTEKRKEHHQKINSAIPKNLRKNH